MRDLVPAQPQYWKTRRQQYWKTPPDLADPNSTSWHYSAKFGRLGLSIHVHRHASRNGDRWVFQPVLTYDRRPTS